MAKAIPRDLCTYESVRTRETGEYEKSFSIPVTQAVEKSVL